MAHSKRNTSLAFFTAHEKSLLKGTWGSQSTRLNRDSFLPFASCNLCLQPSIDPVACALNGEVFCRECIVSNLLAQRKEIKRLEKEDAKRRAEDAERAREKVEEEDRRAVEDFEKTMMGFEGGRQGMASNDTTEVKSKGVKRKFELDEAEMIKSVESGREKARRALEDEKTSKSNPSFWIPAMTPATEDGHKSAAPLKLQPLCPLSNPSKKHNISLKTIVPIQFKQSPTSPANYICPACDKNLSNTVKGIIAIPCGHVLCKPCALKFMSPDDQPPDPHADPGVTHEQGVACYVCDANLTAPVKSKKEGILKPGTIELKSEGTGFAGGGDNMVKTKGTAFQC